MPILRSRPSAAGSPYVCHMIDVSVCCVIGEPIPFLPTLLIKFGYPSIARLVGLLFQSSFPRPTPDEPVIFDWRIRRPATCAPSTPVSTETAELVSLNSLQASSAHSSTNHRPQPPPLDGGARAQEKGPQMPSPRLLADPPSKERTGRSHSVPLTPTLRDRLRD
jgi:hypothetical protein